MDDRPTQPDASVTSAAAAVAQTRTLGTAADAPPSTDAATDAAAADAAAAASVAAAARDGEPAGDEFTIGPGVARAAHGLPYERRPDDPIYRPLWIYTTDPAASRHEGAQAIIAVPYEPLAPGPVGALFEVDSTDAQTGIRYDALDPEAPRVLMSSGRTPSPADPLFHQQMVYAVCSSTYATFRAALGRHVAWGFDRGGGEGDARTRLILRPHAGEATNAWYDRWNGALCFGYYPAGTHVTGRNAPGGTIFTCLSHDIVVHEVTHALLDGLRTHLHLPTGPDVLGFHEGFADAVALLQRFSYREVVRAALARVRGSLTHAGVLAELARQFGETTGTGRALRTAMDVDDDGRPVPRSYVEGAEAHEMGEVLLSAIFDAFLTVFLRKTARYVRLGTGGTGVLPPHEMPADLQAVLAEKASQLASQFLSLCIRAIDYCPPVDLELGEYLRAVITADLELVPDDPWGYREAWMEAFARHRIYPPNVRSLTDDALRWRAPSPAIDRIPALGFDRLQFRGDPARAAGVDELRRQATEFGRMVMRHPAQFGLARRGDPALGGDEVEAPCVQSIRSSRRVGPDGQIVFDLVAEVTQRRTVRRDGTTLDVFGGATAIIGPMGEVRYVIAKNVLNTRRLERQLAFVADDDGQYWALDDGNRMAPRRDFFLALERARGAPGK